MPQNKSGSSRQQSDAGASFRQDVVLKQKTNEGAPRCQGIKKNGHQCTRDVDAKNPYCWQHPPPKEISSTAAAPTAAAVAPPTPLQPSGPASRTRAAASALAAPVAIDVIPDDVQAPVGVELKQKTQQGAARCQGLTQRGVQCPRPSKAGTSYCWQHPAPAGASVNPPPPPAAPVGDAVVPVSTPAATIAAEPVAAATPESTEATPGTAVAASKRTFTGVQLQQMTQQGAARCQGLTQRGVQCPRPSKAGTSHCWQHPPPNEISSTAAAAPPTPLQRSGPSLTSSVRTIAGATSTMSSLQLPTPVAAAGAAGAVSTSLQLEKFMPNGNTLRCQGRNKSGTKTQCKNHVPDGLKGHPFCHVHKNQETALLAAANTARAAASESIISRNRSAAALPSPMPLSGPSSRTGAAVDAIDVVEAVPGHVETPVGVQLIGGTSGGMQLEKYKDDGETLRCQGIYQSGQSVGQQCGNRATLAPAHPFCGQHKSQAAAAAAAAESGGAVVASAVLDFAGDTEMEEAPDVEADVHAPPPPRIHVASGLVGTHVPQGRQGPSVVPQRTHHMVLRSHRDDETLARAHGVVLEALTANGQPRCQGIQKNTLQCRNKAQPNGRCGKHGGGGRDPVPALERIPSSSTVEVTHTHVHERLLTRYQHDTRACAAIRALRVEALEYFLKHEKQPSGNEEKKMLTAGWIYVLGPATREVVEAAAERDEQIECKIGVTLAWPKASPPLKGADLDHYIQTRKNVLVGRMATLQREYRQIGVELYQQCDSIWVWNYRKTVEQMIHKHFGRKREPAMPMDGGTEWFSNLRLSDIHEVAEHIIYLVTLAYADDYKRLCRTLGEN